MSDEICRTEIPELNIGRTLKRLRENAGYTMEAFGEMMGWSKSAVSKVESESRGISAEALYRAATILGVPISDFYPEYVVDHGMNEKPSLSVFADDIREMACALITSGGKLTPDIEEKAALVFLRLMPRTIYRLLKVSPEHVTIRGTLMRGSHFIPRIEIHYTGRKGYDINWFSIILSFRDGLRHIYLSLVQDPDIRFRADTEPVDQEAQLEVMRRYFEKILFDKLPNWEQDWPGAAVKLRVFHDENGLQTEAGTIYSLGYVPVCRSDVYDVTVNDTVLQNMRPFVIENIDSRRAIKGDIIPKQIINTFHKKTELLDEEFSLMDSLDESIRVMFKRLLCLIEDVEHGCFVRWKKDVLTSLRQINAAAGNGEMLGEYAPIMTAKENASARKVIETHGFKCEIDAGHETFIDRQTGKPYVEAAYLIPLRAQGDFKKDLNCEANMICICPICNRMLIHGTDSKIEDLLVPLYYSRKDALKKAGIDITLKRLLDYYEV